MNALIYILIAMFYITMIIAILDMRKSKRDNKDMLLKVDYFEDKLKEAHEKLTNAISYQHSEMINKLDSVINRLENDGYISPQNQYSKMTEEELYTEIKVFVIYNKKASASMLQMQFRLPYAYAASILDKLEQEGIIDSGQGARERRILKTVDDLSTEELPIYWKYKDAFLNQSEDDDMYGDAKQVVLDAGKASASILQRRLRIGYARAARLLDILEAKGVIGPAVGATARDVYAEEEHDENI